MTTIQYSRDASLLQTEGFNIQNYQLYAQRYFNQTKDKIKWILLDFKTGTGKTLTALKMAQAIGLDILMVGNQASIMAFQRDSQKLQMQQIDYVTYQGFVNITDDDIKNKLLIVDEFQNLYSQEGLNSYGEKLKELNITYIIALTGTPVNNIWQELGLICNILQHTDFQMETMTKHKSEIIKICKEHFLSYHQIQHEEDYPSVRYIVDNKPIDKPLEEFRSFPWIECKMTNKQYQLDQQVNHGDEQIIFQRQNLLQYKYYYNPSDAIQPKNNTVLHDVDLKYAPVAEYIIDKARSLLGKCNKMAIYNQMVDVDFGLKQYVQLLKENGFINITDKEDVDTLCIKCGGVYKGHTNKHEFVAARFCIYSSDMTSEQRTEMIQKFNRYSNKNGDQCILILLSKIAETGVSLFGVTDYFITDYIPSFSLYQQVIARCVRYKSHDQLADDMNYVNIYNPVPCGDKGQNSSVMDYIAQMFQDGKEFMSILNEIRKQTIDQKLFGDKKFKQDNMQYIWQFINNQDALESIDQSMLNKLLQNDKLNNLPFSIDSKLTDDQYKRLTDYYYHNEHRKHKWNYSDLIYNKVQLNQKQTKTFLESIMYDTKIYLPAVKQYIKQYSKEIIERNDLYLKKIDNIITAVFIYEGFVYMKNDEKKFEDNHQKLWKDVYDKTYFQIIDKQAEIVKKHNILGIYFTDKCITAKSVKQIEQQSSSGSLVFTITKSIPTLKLNDQDFILMQKRELTENINKTIRQNILQYYEDKKVVGFHLQ